MQEFLKPIPLLAIAVAIALAILGQYALAGVCAVAWIGSLAIGQMRVGNAMREADSAEALDPDGRSRFSRVKGLTAEIEAIVERPSTAPVIRALGKDAVAEARRIRDQVAAALVRRSALRKILAGRSSAEIEIKKLEERQEAATSPEEKTSLASAQEARRIELDHYQSAQQAMDIIDSGIRQAEAALSEMKARLEFGITRQQAEISEPIDELRDTIGRLKAISVSYDEADEVMQS